jgi:hypothetical protein
MEDFQSASAGLPFLDQRPEGFLKLIAACAFKPCSVPFPVPPEITDLASNQNSNVLQPPSEFV